MSASSKPSSSSKPHHDFKPSKRPIVRQINRGAAEKWIEEFTPLLKQTAKDLGYLNGVMSSRVTHNPTTMKFQVTIYANVEGATAHYQVDWNNHCLGLNLTREDWKKTFVMPNTDDSGQHAGHRVETLSINKRSKKYPIIMKDLVTREEFCLHHAYVREMLDRERQLGDKTVKLVETVKKLIDRQFEDQTKEKEIRDRLEKQNSSKPDRFDELFGSDSSDSDDPF